MTVRAVQASSIVRENTDTQSSVRHAGTTPGGVHAGTTPEVDTSPRLGFRPTMLLRPAGIRPDPAVSVPSDKGTIPEATATAEPELEPPGISSTLMELRGPPNGAR